VSHSDTLIRKAASDAGFDIETGLVEGWLGFAVSGAPIKAWVRGMDRCLYLSLSSPAVLNEMPGRAADGGPSTQSPAGAISCATFEELLAALTRARVLDATLPDRLHSRWKERLAQVSATETEAVVRQRIGQDLFREGLMDYWEGRCAVTRLDVPELLRASHAKPWKDATDEERLDVHNGLLLAVHLDALFDKGLLAFDELGNGLLSRRLSPETLRLLGLQGKAFRLARCVEGHLPYLRYHRENIFRPD
jgi:hypothetical protein